MQQVNYGYLLGGLLTLILGSAIAHEEGFLREARNLLIEPAFCLMLLLGVWSLKGEKKWYIAGGIIVGTAIIFSTINMFWDVYALRLLNMGIVLAFCLASTGIASRNLLQVGQVDVNKIIGAICVYLLLGVTWAFFISSSTSLCQAHSRVCPPQI